jgi:hypothetical protein
MRLIGDTTAKDGRAVLEGREHGSSDGGAGGGGWNGRKRKVEFEERCH